MTFLNWAYKDKIVNLHKTVQFQLLKEVKKLSTNNYSETNMLIEGDNLAALRSLLPYYKGKINCVYIDPPYNTGNEKWIYNDNVNSPGISKWFQKYVTSEDLSRHDKWLCMMYPRIILLKQLMAKDGVIFVSIDDNELHNLRMLLDEIFGDKNFYAVLNWKARNKPMNAGAAKYKIQKSQEYILVYGNTTMRSYKGFNLPVKETKKYPYSDDNGEYRLEEIQQRKNDGVKKSDAMVFEILGIIPKPGFRWTVGNDNIHEKIKNGGVEIRKGRPCQKFYKKNEDQNTYEPFWANLPESVGTSETGKKELDVLVPNHGFETVKPTELIKRILRYCIPNDGIVLDSFSGSGTTGDAVLQLNKENKSNIKCIMVEMEKNIIQKVLLKRLKKVIERETGNFAHYKLGNTLFDKHGQLNRDCSFLELSNHIFFMETGSPLNNKEISGTLLGSKNDTEIHLIFEGFEKENVLNFKRLRKMNKTNKKIVYADHYSVPDEKLKERMIKFKQIPYEVPTF